MTSFKITNRVTDITIAVISVILLLYSGYRAATLSFTIDESISFNVFVPLRFMGIISYKIASSNHHMLNTLAMKFMSAVFGSGELSLRFPSIVCQLFYIIFTYKIVKKNASPYLVLPCFLLLNLNPYMIDFFSLARGYAMAVTFTVISIYYLLEYVESKLEKNLIYTLIFSVLAILSNFSLLDYYVSLIAVINLYWISSINRFDLKAFFKKNIPIIICSLVLVLILFEPLRKLIKYEEFYDGGIVGFWPDTVGSLVRATLYEKPYQFTAAIYLSYFIEFSAIVFFLSIIYNLLRLKLKAFSEKTVVMALLLFLPCIVTIAQHYILKSNFLINRMALFFIPIFLLNIFLIIDEYSHSVFLKLITRSLVFSLAFILSVHAINCVNDKCALYWNFDADTKTMLNDLDSMVKKDGISNVKLGVMTLYEPAINFYRLTKKYEWLEKVTEDGYRDRVYDFYYLGDSSANYIASRKLSVLQHYPLSNSVLVK